MLTKKYIKNLLLNVRDSVSYLGCSVKKDSSPVASVVFVCKGNICRSAFAEKLLKAKLSDFDGLSIASCGLEVDEEESSPPFAKAMAQRFGVSLEDHRSLNWDQCNLAEADLILPMEFWQYQRLMKFFPQKKNNIKLLRDFSPFPENLLCNIPDPYGSDKKTFENCFKQIERSLKPIIKKCLDDLEMQGRARGDGSEDR